jgi:hypothetical protein
VARLQAVNPVKKKPRVPGLLRGKLKLSDAYFDPLPPGYDGLPDAA